MKITTALFGEIVIGQDELRPSLDGSGLPLVDHRGQPRQFWSRTARMRHVYRVFPLTEGWRLVVSSRPSAYTIPSGVDSGGQPIIAPTREFEIKLISPQGVDVCNATSLAVLNGFKAWEAAETNVRSRLLEALGLLNYPLEEDVDSDRVRPADEQGSSALSNAASEPVAAEQPIAAAATKPEAFDPLAGLRKMPADERPSDMPAPASVARDHADTESRSERSTAAAAATPAAPSDVRTAIAPTAQARQADAAVFDASISRALRDKISRRARMKGVTIPMLNSRSEAESFYTSIGG